MRDMTTDHVCVFFDDGDDDHLCGCGERALVLVGEDGLEVLVMVESDGALVSALTSAVTDGTDRHAHHEHLLVSA